VLCPELSASSFWSKLNPKKAKTTESKPAAAMAPAPTPTVAGDGVAKPSNVIPAPIRANPRPNKRKAWTHFNLPGGASCAGGGMEGELTIGLLAALQPVI